MTWAWAVRWTWNFPALAGGRCRGPGGIAGQRGHEPGTAQEISLGPGGLIARPGANYYET
jgi:hypothetical protein